MSVPAWFDKDFYFQNKLVREQALNPDAGLTAATLAAAFAEAGFNPNRAEDLYQHFLSFGNSENVSPSRWFDVEYYKEAKLRQLQASGETYTMESMEQGFNDLGLSFWDHYRLAGAKEGLDPSSYFSTNAYMEAKLQQAHEIDPNYTLDQLHAAFQSANLNPIEHYVLFGCYENLGYTPTPVPAPDLPLDPESTFVLTTDADAFYGGDGDDSFLADAGTLQSQDVLDGGNGNDTLSAVLGTANADSPLNPSVRNVENLLFTVTRTDGNAAVSLENVELAEDRQLTVGSVGSLGDLAINNIAHASTQTAILFQNALPGTALNASFTAESLRTENISTGGSLVLQLIDTNGALSNQPLLNNPYTGFTFIATDNGSTEVVKLHFGYVNGAGADYQDLLDAINGALYTFGYTDITATLGEEFHATNPTTGAIVTGRNIVLTAASGELQIGNWLAAGGMPGSNATSANMQSIPGEVYPGMVSTTVELDNVGRMDWDVLDGIPDSSQLYGGSAGPVSVAGMQKYNLVVDRGAWVSSLTTDTALQAVSVTNRDLNGDGVVGSGGADAGNLILGDSAHAGIQDVRVFDASTMTGKAIVNASISGESTVEGSNTIRYAFGSNNDTLHLALDGQTASGEDFTMKIDMGAGSDNLLLHLTSAATTTLGRGLSGVENATITSAEPGAENVVSLMADNALQTLTAGSGVALNLDATLASSLQQVTFSTSRTADTLSIGYDTSDYVSLRNFSRADDKLNITANAFSGVDLTDQKEYFGNWDSIKTTGATLLDNSLYILAGTDFSDLQISTSGAIGTIGVAAGESAVIALNDTATGSIHFYIVHGDNYIDAPGMLAEQDHALTITGVGYTALTDDTIAIEGA